MGRRIAIEYQCDRCGVTWYEDYDVSSGKPERTPPALVVDMAFGESSRKVEFGTLCGSCAETCHNYLNAIAKDLKRKPKAKKEESAAGAAPPPTETPKVTPLGSSSLRTAGASASGRSK